MARNGSYGPQMQPFRVRCKRCGNVFLKTKGAEKYCSAECRNAANRESIKAAQKRHREKVKALEESAANKEPEEPIAKDQPKQIPAEMERKQKNEKYSIFINCARCGVPMVKKGPNHKYCPECSKLIEKARDVKRMKEKKQTAYVMPYSDEDYVCKSAKDCEYGSHLDGSQWCCGYREFQGKCRSVGDNQGKHKITNGKCDLYRKRTKRRKDKDHEGI